jgi:DNA polymerase-3 subunit gamma/tau
MLSTSAFNALLKTIEEPPEYVVFIFATTETQKVPATIRSRCQQFHFQLIPLETIKEVLARTAMEMGIAAEEEALFWIAKESTGSMRDAYTLFDQVVSFSHGNITMDRIEEQLGLAGMDKLSAIVEAVGAGEGQAAIGALHSLLDAGVSVEQAIKDLANYMRTLLLAKRGVTSESTLGMRLNQIPAGILDVFAEEQLEAALELFFSLYRDIRFSLNPRFELELAISRLLNLRYMASSVTLVNKIEALKAQLLDPASVAQVVVKPAPQIVEARPTEPKTIAQKVSKTIEDEPLPPKETIIVKENPPSPAVQSRQITKELLPELIQQLAAERDPVGIVLSQVVEVSHDDQALRFVFASKYAMDTAKQNEERLRTLVSRHTATMDRCSSSGSSKRKEAQAPAEKRTTDELAHTIATLFRGEVLAPSRPEEK